MEFWSAVASIVLIDLVLSGDNALVIGMAAHGLPSPQRRQAIVAGGVAAAVLRIALTAVAALLLGATAPRHGRPAPALDRLPTVEETRRAWSQRAPGSLREAVLTILVADVVMSLDKVLVSPAPATAISCCCCSVSR